MSINFNDLVLRLFVNNEEIIPDQRLPVEYFKREFFKAQKEHHDAKSFFGSCEIVMDRLVSVMKEQYCYAKGPISLDPDGNIYDLIEPFFETCDKEFYFQLPRDIENQSTLLFFNCDDFLKIKEAISKAYNDAISQNEETDYNSPSSKVIKFKLSNKRSAKTNIIRILNALYELKYIIKENGEHPEKKDFMESFGDFLSIDLSAYHSDLSQSLNETSLDANLEVFRDMIKITEEAHYEIKNKKK